MIQVRRMTPADIPLGMRLKEQAGWNQTEADWSRALSLEPEGCFVADYAGAPAATTTTCIFGSVAWIALVLVDQTLRRRGIAMALMRHALDYLEERGVRSVHLHATPLGQPLYAKLGFVEEYRLLRYAGTLPPAEPIPNVGTAQKAQWTAAIPRPVGERGQPHPAQAPARVLALRPSSRELDLFFADSLENRIWRVDV